MRFVQTQVRHMLTLDIEYLLNGVRWVRSHGPLQSGYPDAAILLDVVVLFWAWLLQPCGYQPG